MGQKSNARKGKNAPTTCSPSVGKKSDTAGSVASSRCVGCVGCGVTIQNETRALHCDKCMKDKWKCIECLGMPAEVDDGLIDCKDIFWFCEDCSCDKQKDMVSGDDRVISLLQKMMDRLGAIEDRLKEKADEKKVEELDQRVKSLELFVKEQLEEREQNTGVRKSRGSMNDARSSAVENVDSIEDRETEKRRNNIGLRKWIQSRLRTENAVMQHLCMNSETLLNSNPKGGGRKRPTCDDRRNMDVVVHNNRSTYYLHQAKLLIKFHCDKCGKDWD